MLEQVRTRFAKKLAIVPWMPEEPVGPARLLALAHGRGVDQPRPALQET